MGPLALLLLALAAQEPGRPIVPGFERFADEPAEGGRLLLGELGCVACHKGEGIVPKRAPLLSDAGTRLRPEWIRATLADPHKTKPGTTMPRPGVAPDEIEPLVHYVMSLRADRPLEVWSGPGAKAKEIYHRVGCAACHQPLDKDDIKGVPLGDLAAKYSGAAALAHFLYDPLKWRPAGRMPRLNLSHGEAMALAAQLVGLPPREPDEPGETVPGLVYDYFEGSWGKAPDWDQLKPVTTGTVPTFDIKHAKREDGIGFRFRGYLDVPREGHYTFYTTSDDGSVLKIGNVVVVNNDGVHAPQETSGTIHLKAGKHLITVGWFEAGGGEELAVHYEGPGIPKRHLPAQILSRPKSGVFSVREERGPGPAFVPDPALVKKGKDLFASRRCAACHEPKAPEAKPLAELKSAQCRALDFALGARQAEAIRAALGKADSPTAAQRVTRTLTTFNCYACHERSGRGGPEPARDPFFSTTAEAMGDEGRVPPALTGVGTKLKKSWLQALFADSSKAARPHMLTRMPTFGLANVGHLVEDFALADGAGPDVPRPNRDNPMVGAGRRLSGTKGLSCVQCHTFGSHKSLGVPGMDLLLMPQRLRYDWFVKYLIDPAGLRPGTRMPTFWPEGKGVLKDVLDGDTHLQVEALWKYLYEGNGARLPAGIGPQPIPLVPPKDEAMVYRNFIQGAGPRAIGVGYPERVNLAFDANQLRVALLWKGDFIDASKHWIDRGSGFQAPAGEDVLALPEGPPFAVLADPNAPWPAAPKGKGVYKPEGCRFEGYELDAKRRPTFLYSCAGASVKDFFEPAAGGFRRTLAVESAPDALWYRAAAASSVVRQPDGSYKASGLTIRVEGEPALRKGQELLVPVKGKATIVVRYAW